VSKQPSVVLREGSPLASDIPEGAVVDIVETVDQRTGKRVFFKAYTPDELTQVMREAKKAIGRDPLMLGVRQGGVQATDMRSVVEASRRAEGSFIRIGQDTFTKTIRG
jgi:hypothetical protein